MRSGALQAGVAAVNITPPVGGFLQGYTRGTPSIGVHRELYAKALVLAAADTWLGLVTLDLIGLDQATVAAIRAEISATTPVPGPQVMIACSHTHAGPHVQGTGEDVWGFAAGNGLDHAFVATLVRKVAGAVGMAARTLRPAAIGMGMGESGFNISRRLLTEHGVELRPDPTGPVDRRVPVITVMDAASLGPTDRPEAPPRVILFAYGCHPTIMAMENLEISPDYPGIAQEFVEQAYGGGPTSGAGLPDGPGTLALFAQGCSADLRPNLTTPDGSRFRAGTKADAHRLGRQLGAAVVKAAESVTTWMHEAELACGATRLRLPFAELPGRADLEQIVAAGGTRTFGGHRAVDGRPLSDADWAHYMLQQLDRGPLPADIEVEVQGLRIGDLHIVGLPGEAMGAIGRQIEAALPGPALVLSQANGNVGYLCTEEAHRLGGYEPAVAWMLYHLPAPFDASTEHLLVQAGRTVLAEAGRALALR